MIRRAQGDPFFGLCRYNSLSQADLWIDIGIELVMSLESKFLTEIHQKKMYKKLSCHFQVTANTIEGTGNEEKLAVSLDSTLSMIMS